MTAKNRAIHKVLISMHGEWESGIPDTLVILGKDGDALFCEEDMLQQNGDTAPAEEFRQKIKEAFEAIWGEKPEVRFDIEDKDEADRIDAMYDYEFCDESKPQA